MDAQEYQTHAQRMLLNEPDFEIAPRDVMVTWMALGLAGESGEVADLVKKGIFQQQGLNMDRLRKEFGDVCWYLAGMMSLLGVSFNDILEENLEKINKRFPAGWDATKSAERNDEIDQQSENIYLSRPVTEL